MGKASRRKKERRASERRSIEPMQHTTTFAPSLNSSASIPALAGMASTSTSTYVGPYGMILTSSAVSALVVSQATDEPDVAHPRAQVMRSTEVRHHSGFSTKEAETAIGAVVAKAWSVVSGADWRANIDYPQDSDIDLDLSAEGHQTAYAQLTRSQPSDSWELKQGDSYQTSHTMDEAAEEVMRAVREKRENLPSRSDLVLVLDAYVLPLPEPVLRRIYADHTAELETSGFEEIWYVAIQPRVAVRLYPGFLAVKFPSDASDDYSGVTATSVGGMRCQKTKDGPWESVTSDFFQTIIKGSASVGRTKHD